MRPRSLSWLDARSATPQASAGGSSCVHILERFGLAPGALIHDTKVLIDKYRGRHGIYSLGAPLRNPCVKKRGPDLARRQAKKNTEPRRV